MSVVREKGGRHRLPVACGDTAPAAGRGLETKGASHLFLGFFLVGALLALAGGAVAAEPIAVGAAEQLFLDDHVVAETHGIGRRVSPARKQPQPVLRPDRPWENGRTVIYGSVLREPESGLFRMWYSTARGEQMAMATSPDGLAWTKPALNLAAGKGGEDNAVIWRTPGWKAQAEDSSVKLEPGPFGHFYECAGVIRDDADPDPARRYKTVFISIDHGYFGPPTHRWMKQYKGSKTKDWRRGLGTAVSPDGIHWKVEQEFASEEVFDYSHLMWDPVRRKYVIYGRVNLAPETDPEGKWAKWNVGRAVTRIESDDFRTWSQGEVVMAVDRADPSESEVYSMAVFPYEGVYVGLVQLYHHIPGTLQQQLAVSRDGIRFTRVADRSPFIAEGQHGEWDEFNISVADNPPLLVGDDMWFYYGGRNCRHPGHKMEPHEGDMIWSIGLAKTKRGRFLALVADGGRGSVVTKPLALDGGELVVNADTKRGAMRVTLLDGAGQPLPGYEATVRGVDSVAEPVRFKQGELAALRNKPVAIRFDLESAELFGFRVAP
jgi:hypothetical protein